MRCLFAVLAIFALGCGDGSGGDGGVNADGSLLDGGRPLRDSGCGPQDPAGSDPECVLETCFGGMTCVNGPCPYPCCELGRLEVCEYGPGSECAAPPPMDCGGGTCVQAGDACP